VNIQLNIVNMSCVRNTEKVIRDNAVAPSGRLQVVIVTVPFLDRMRYNDNKKVVKSGATTSPRMNFSGQVGHVTIILFNAYYCVLFSSRVRVGIRVRIRVSYVHVFVLL